MNLRRIESILDALQPELPPTSREWDLVPHGNASILVRRLVAGGRVLGTGETQYAVTATDKGARTTWQRHAWRTETVLADPWRPSYDPCGVVGRVSELLPPLPVVVVRRMVMQDAHRRELVFVRGEYREPEQVSMLPYVVGPFLAGDEERLPPCWDCGGDLVWSEAGSVPYSRTCTSCGSVYRVHHERNMPSDGASPGMLLGPVS